MKRQSWLAAGTAHARQHRQLGGSRGAGEAFRGGVQLHCTPVGPPLMVPGACCQQQPFASSSACRQQRLKPRAPSNSPPGARVCARAHRVQIGAARGQQHTRRPRVSAAPHAGAAGPHALPHRGRVILCRGRAVSFSVPTLRQHAAIKEVILAACLLSEGPLACSFRSLPIHTHLCPPAAGRRS